MTRTNLRLVASQPAEAVLAHRLTEANSAWLTLCAVPFLPQSWFAWVGACDRLEGERLRFLHQPRRSHAPLRR